MQRKFKLNPARVLATMALVFAGLCLIITKAKAASPLFAKGATESFSLIDVKTKKPPQVTVLNDDPMQISLAAIVGKALQFPADDNGLTLKLERLEFIPINTTKNITASANKLNLRARVSGRNFDLEPTISRSDFEKGKLITIKFPIEKNETPVATITSSGDVQLKYDSSSDTIEIPHGHGEVSYDSKLGLNGERKLNFVAHGTHVKP